MTASSVLHFWFDELKPQQWFGAEADLDQKIRDRFSQTHERATRGELFEWRQETEGRLAEILVLDQFSRNIYRNDARAFASDPLALILAQELVHLKLDQGLAPSRRAFAYMPYMHSESKLIHEQAVLLFAAEGLEGNLKFEHLHKSIIDRFGRYPHRNAVLNRTSTPEELEFLKTFKGF